MKTSVNKDFTTLAQLPKVKADLREFKERYNDGDLKRAFCDAVSSNGMYCADIVSVDVEGFPAGSVFNDETHFSVTMLCRDYGNFYDAHFYCDMNLTVDTRDAINYGGTHSLKMYRVDVYKLVK